MWELITESNDGKRALFPHDPVEFIYVQAFWSVVYLRCKRSDHKSSDVSPRRVVTYTEGYNGPVRRGR